MQTSVRASSATLAAERVTPPAWAVVLLGAQAIVSSTAFDAVGSPGTPWVLAVCIAPLFLVALRSSDLPGLLVAPGYRAATLWLLWLTLSIAWSITPLTAARDALAILGTWFTAAWFVLAFGFQAFARVYTGAMALFLTSGFLRDLTILFDAGSVHRFAGYSPHPNNLAHAALFTVLLSIVLIVEFRQRTAMTWWSLTIGTVALAATGSRTAFFALFVALSLMMYRRLGLARMAMIGLVLACAVVTVTSLVPEPTQIVTRDENTRDLSSVNGRSTIWPIAIRATLESPIVGQGVSASGVVFPQASRRGDLPFPNVVHAHNMLLEISLSTGLIGLALFGLLLASYVSTRPRDRAGLASTIVVAMLIAGLTEPVLHWLTSAYLVLGALITERALGGASNQARTTGPERADAPIRARDELRSTADCTGA